MDAQQLTLWDWLNEASQVVDQLPQLIAVTDGIAALEQVMIALTDKPVLDQLAVASEAFVQLSDLLERKSQEWLEEWRREGVSAIDLSQDWTAGLVRQSAYFDLSSLVETPEPPLKPKRIRRTSDSSLAAPVDSERLLEMLIQIAASPETVQQQLLNLAGNETPTEWAKQIAEAMQQYHDSSQHPTDHIPFAILQQTTGLSTTELWLGLLLGGYTLANSPKPKPHTHGGSASDSLDPIAEAFYQSPYALQIKLTSLE